MTTQTANSKSKPKSTKTSGGFTSLMSALAIVISLIAGVIIYKVIFGDPGNFVDGDINGEPLDGSLLATIYKGGVIVPILVAINFIIIIFSFERLVTLARARGVKNALIQFLVFIFFGGLIWLIYYLVTKKKNIKPAVFLSEFRKLLKNGEIDSAIELCDKTQSSLANVVRAGLQKYKSLVNDNSMDKEQKIESLKKELEEATSLELPMLSKNLVVISTCASVATLIGLIGTVMGMIRSFAAMSQGAPDTAQLATGISEALINTFFGIAGSTIAIIMYNFFSTKIDSMTYSIDEASFTIIQDFSNTK
jgi:biopolymer transport protein ExbB